MKLFVMTNEENDRLKNLPKWAQSLITRMMSRIKQLEQELIDATTGDENSRGTVRTVSRMYDNKPLRDGCAVEFNLKDSILKGRECNYRHNHCVKVKIIKDIETGGECLEIYSTGDDHFSIIPHSANIFYLRPNDIVRENFAGFIDFDKELGEN